MDTYYDEMQSIANSKGADETVDQLKQRILREAPQMGPQPEQALRLLLPENCIVPPEQRAARALLSQQMRDKQAGILANAAGIKQGRLLDNFARVSDAVKSYYLHLGQPDKVTQFLDLFADPGTDEAQLEALMGDGRTEQQAQTELTERKQTLAQQRGAFLQEMMQPFTHYGTAELCDLSDEQLVQQYESVHLFQTFIMHAEQVLRWPPETITLTDEQKQLFTKWKDMLLLTDNVSSRTDLIANPYYEMLDHQRLADDTDRSKLIMLLGQYKDLAKAPQDPEAAPRPPITQALVASMNRAYALKNSIEGLSMETIEQQLREEGVTLPEYSWKYTDEHGNPRGIDKTEIFEGRTVYVQADGKAWKLSAVQTPNGKRPVVEAPDTGALLDQLDQNFSAERNELKAALKGAELRLRGSKEYDNITKSVEALEKLGTLGKHPTPYQCEQMKQHLEALQQASQTYLDTKGARGKNEREQKRMDAARSVQEFAKRKLQQLALAAGSMATNAARAATSAEGRIFGQSAEEREARKEVQQSHINESLEKRRIELIHEKARELCTRTLPVVECDLLRPTLQMQLQSGLNTTLGCIQSTTGELSDGQKNWAKETMVQMTAMELVTQMVESRKASKNPVELGQKLFPGSNTGQLLESIRKSPLLKEAVKDLTPRSFGDFIAFDGARDLSRRIIADAAERSKQAKQGKPNKAVQKENDPLQLHL